MRRHNRDGRSHSGSHRTHGTLRLEPLEPRLLLSAAEPTVELFNALPALFVENQGQWPDASVRFAHAGNGANVALTDMGPVFQVFRQEMAADAAATSSDPLDPPDDVTHMLEFAACFVGAQAVSPVGLDPSGAVFNYYVGDQANWRSGVPSYQVVVYPDLYPGVDLHVWGRRSSLKYEFHVAPGADYGQIQVRYDGIAGLSVAQDDSLEVDLGGGWGTLTDDAPFIYQEIDGRQAEVPGRFVLIDGQTYGFELGMAHDPAETLVIDPLLAWSSYLGGSSLDRGNGIAVDGAGDVLVTGETESSGWVSGGSDTSLGGDTDAFVAKLSSEGAHLWSTYLGGESSEEGYGIAVDGAGDVLVTGTTQSSDWVSGGFDTSLDGGTDAFAAKLSGAGAHVWSTYLGGGSSDLGSGIAADGSGNVLVTGYTQSSDWASGGFDTSQNGDRDAFVAKLSGAGAHVWSTYLGGSDGDFGTGIATVGAGDVLVTGYTQSSGWVSGGFDTSYGGSNDAFVAKLNGAGAHVWSTYLGGGDGDEGHSIAVDGSGDVLVTGETESSGWVSGGFDTSQNGHRDVFVAKLSGVGAHLWSTYLGGESSEEGYGIAVDGVGGVLVTGTTYSSDWVSGGFDTTYNGDGDTFVAKLSGAGAHEWSTYLGGDEADWAHGIAVHTTGDVLVTGETASSGWVSGGFDTSHNGGYWDAFAAKISTNHPPTIASLTSEPDPAAAGEDLTLTAGGVTDLEGNVESVSFYRDANLNGTLEPGTDELLGTDTNGVDGWACVVATTGWDLGEHVLLAQVTDSACATSNVVTTVARVGEIVVLDRANRKFRYTDADGDAVTVTFGGKAGTAQIVRAAGPGGPGDIMSITLDGTDAKTTLTIKTQGKGSATTVGDISVDGSAKKLTAKTTELAGDLTVDDWLGKAQFADVDHYHTITLGGTEADKPITFIAGHVEDITFTSGAPVKAFTVLDWLDTDGTPDTFSAPSLAALTTQGQKAKAKKGIVAIAGDFEACLDLDGTGDPKYVLGKAKIAGSVSKGTWTVAGAVNSITSGLDFCADLDALSVKSMSVKRNLDGATIDLTQAVGPKLKALAKLIVTGWTRDTAITSAGHVAKFQTGGMDSSCLMLGLAGTELPDEAADFTDEPLLNSFTVKGIKVAKAYVDSFIDSDVAAWCIAKAAVREVVTDNAGDAFGFAGCELLSITWPEGGEKFKWPEKNPTDWPDDTGDFTVVEVV